MDKNKNIKETSIGQTVTIGRMKGNINLGDKIYKLSSKKLNLIAKNSINGEHRKIPLNCSITIKHNEPLQINITPAFSENDALNDVSIYSNMNITYTSDIIPETAENRPLEREKVIEQINKTNNSIFYFKNINIDLDNNIFLTKFSATLNDLRRKSLDLAYEFAISNIKRTSNANISNDYDDINSKSNVDNNSIFKEKNISVLLNILNTDFNYTDLTGFDNVYIPLKYFSIKKYSKIITDLQNKFNIYIYMPTIIRANYRNLFFANIENTIKTYKIKGFIISNISNLRLLEKVVNKSNFEIIANYTFNIFNLYSVNELKNLGINKFTISPESTKEIIDNLCNSTVENNNFERYLPAELIVYGKTPLMNMNYCVLGKTNKCYPTCDSKCMSENSYYLKDRLNMKFRILFDNIQTVSTIYNCKTTSISADCFNTDCLRIDILDESIDEINNIVCTVKNNERFEGKEFTNGNLNRSI